MTDGKYKIAAMGITSVWVLLLLSFYLIEMIYPNARIDNVIFHVRFAFKLEMIDPEIVALLIAGTMLLLVAVSLTIYFVPSRCVIAFSTLGMLVTFYTMGQRYNLFNYIYYQMIGHDVYATEYVDPRQLKITPPQKKTNLIMLYVESLETTYTEPSIFEQNLLPRLSEMAKTNQSFSHYDITTGTGWTQAATVATKCGVALNLLSRRNLYIDTKNYFPNISCMHDILYANGYNQVHLEGSNIVFAGGKCFLENRAENSIKIIDGDYFQKKYGENGSWWGGKDSLLYKRAKAEISHLASLPEPFAISVYTIDTHQPNGYLDESCPTQYNDFRDIVSCADQMAANFLNWIQQQSFAKDTVVVVVGDHLAITNPLYLKFIKPNQSHRGIFNMFINSRVKAPTLQRQFTAFDVFPSVMEAMGFAIPGHRLGLGRSLFANPQLPTMYEQLGEDKLSEVLMYQSDTYRNFIKK